MRAYLAFTRNVFISFVVYRFGVIFTFIGNLLYMALVYFLWRSIYRDAEMIRGMTFNQAFVYLALANSIFVLFKTWTDWMISRRIIDGTIIMDLIKPMDFQLQMLSRSTGFALSNCMAISLPSALMLLLVFRAEIPLAVGLAFFPLALVLAFLISFTFDYVVGLSSFFTQSLWGISMTKEILITLLSGALIPLQFFPENARRLLQLLPFQAIYHIPLSLVTSPDLSVTDCLRLLGIQALWVVILFILSRLFFRQAIRVLTVSGG